MLRRSATLAACLGLAVACSSNAAPEPGISAWLPQVSVGKVVAHPKIVPILFPGDPWTTQIEDFLPKLAASSYFGALAEYGVGTASVAPPVVWSGAPPPTLDDDGLVKWLGDAFAARPELGLGDEGALFVFFWPPGAAVSTAAGTSCQQIGGFHQRLDFADGRSALYAVVFHCDQVESRELGGTEAGLDLLTNSAAHEIVEAVTDLDLASTVPEDSYRYAAIGGGGEL